MKHTKANVIILLKEIERVHRELAEDYETENIERSNKYLSKAMIYDDVIRLLENPDYFNSIAKIFCE